MQDFYLQNHWNTLPKSWTNTLNTVQPCQLAALLCNDQATESPNRIIWPLSLLCLQNLVKQSSIVRCPIQKSTRTPSTYTHPKLRHIFSKHVKHKKRHEIEQMSAECYRTARECNVQYVVDVGAGLGHLARLLGFGYGLKVCCLEEQPALSKQAT